MALHNFRQLVDSGSLIVICTAPCLPASTALAMSSNCSDETIVCLFRPRSASPRVVPSDSAPGSIAFLFRLDVRCCSAGILQQIQQHIIENEKGRSRHGKSGLHGLKITACDPYHLGRLPGSPQPASAQQYWPGVRERSTACRPAAASSARTFGEAAQQLRLYCPGEGLGGRDRRPERHSKGQRNLGRGAWLEVPLRQPGHRRWRHGHRRCGCGSV